MSRFTRASVCVTAVTLVAFLTACAGGRAPAPLTRVPITDIKALAGKWAGLMRGASRRPESDFVEVTIKADGTYEFASVRMVGIFSGSGTVEVVDGMLVSASNKGRAVFTLHERPGERVLRVVGTTKSGVTLSAELTPTQ